MENNIVGAIDSLLDDHGLTVAWEDTGEDTQRAIDFLTGLRELIVKDGPNGDHDFCIALCPISSVCGVACIVAITRYCVMAINSQEIMHSKFGNPIDACFTELETIVYG